MLKIASVSLQAVILVYTVHLELVLSQCLAGQYNLSSCQNCPAGSYRTTPGGTSLSDCIPCTAGKFGTIPGQTSESTACTGSCSSGLWSAPGSSSAQACIGCQTYNTTLVSTGGGTLFKDVPGYNVHQYKISQATVTFSRDVVADVFLIGGGGGGGANAGGGGGAGSVLYYSGYKFFTGKTYSFTVGSGGAGGVYSAIKVGTTGTDTTLKVDSTTNVFVAKAGGGGGIYVGGACSLADGVGSSGGSGGGGGSCGTTPGGYDLIGGSPASDNTMSQISGYTTGFSGGRGSGNSKGAGGGGAGTAGGSATSVGGVGGDGIYQVSWAGSFVDISSLFGSAFTGVASLESNKKFYVAGGGGAGGYGAASATTYAGGKGGGGFGVDGSTNTAQNGQTNTGSGGGGGAGGGYNGGSGGSGLILLRYSLCQPCVAGTILINAGPGGTCTVCGSGSYSVSGQTVCQTCPANSISVNGVCRAATGYFGPTLRMFDGISSVFENLGSVTHGVVPTGTLPAYGTVGQPSRSGAFFDSSASNGYVTLSNTYTEMTISFRMYLTGIYDNVTQYQFAPINLRVSSATASSVRIELDGRSGAFTQGRPWFWITYSSDVAGLASSNYVLQNDWVLITLTIPEYNPDFTVFPRFYWNGSFKAQPTTRVPGYLPVYDRIILGANLIDSRFYRGYLQDVRLYSVALSIAQVKSIAEGNVYMPCTTTCSADQTVHCSSNGTAVCCGPGQFFRDGLDTSCSNCAAGSFTQSSNSIGCNFCEVGKYSLAKAASCSNCTNSLSANQYYSSYGTTANGCTKATCTNALANQYYTSPVGAYQRVTPQSCAVTNCSNAKVYQYYFGGGGASAPTTNTCPIAPTNCTNARAPGYYFSSAGTTDPASCGLSKCNNTLMNNQYYTGFGDTNPRGCAVGTCTNTLGQGQYFSAPSFDTQTGCNISACANQPPNSQYPLTALNLNATCAFLCNPGYYLNAQTNLCEACPPQTFNPNPGGVGLFLTCQACTAGYDYPSSLADLDTTSNGLSKCKWSCRTGYDAAADGSLVCLPSVTSALNELSIQNFAILADQVNSSHARLARLNFSGQTTETLATVQASVQSLALDPSGNQGYALDSSRPHAVFSFAISKSPQPSLAIIAGSPSAPGSANGSFLGARFSNLTILALPSAGQFLLAVDQDGTALRKLDLATSQVSTLRTFSPGKIRAAACSRDGAFAILAWETEIYSLSLQTGALSLVAGSTTANYTDGQGAAARFRTPSSVAVSPDAAYAYVLHAATAAASTDTVLRSIDLSTQAVATVARSASLANGLLSVGLAPSRSVWAASRTNLTVTQLNSSGFSALTVYGVAGQGIADDLLSGTSHTEKFQSISAFAVWACGRRGYDCSSTDPLFATACERGYSSDGVAACAPCAAGTYAQDYASPACYPCTAPNYTTYQRSTSCKACQADCGLQYRSGCGGASQGTCQSCQSCPAGQRRAQCANFSSGTCEPCPNLPAPHQYYVPNPECGVSACTNPLPAGNFWSLTGWTSATNCSYAPCANKPANSAYTAYNNLDPACKYACNPGYTGAACQPCARGYYAPFSDSQQCYPCQGGTFAADQGSPSCAPCPAGSFMPSQNATQCLPCPNGTAAPYTQNQQCPPCPPGYVAQQGSTACTQCTPGYYADQSSLTACLPCSTGYYTTGAQTSCDTCPAGSFTVSQVGPCQSCLQGQFSTLASTSCTPCPPATFAQVPSEACTPCVQGTHYPLNAVLLNTTGNAACDFRCADNYTETLTAQSAMCIQLDPAMKSFLFEAYVQQATLTPAQIQSYQAVLAQALGVREISAQVVGVNQSYLFVNFRSNVLQSVVQAPTQQTAVLLAGQVYTSLFQQNINQAVQARGLASAVVLPNSLRYLFEFPPTTTPQPPSPAQTIAIDITNVSFSASARQRSPSDNLAGVLVLATFLTINLIK